jgi:hypothetical protein
VLQVPGGQQLGVYHQANDFLHGTRNAFKLTVSDALIMGDLYHARRVVVPGTTVRYILSAMRSVTTLTRRQCGVMCVDVC